MGRDCSNGHFSKDVLMILSACTDHDLRAELARRQALRLKGLCSCCGSVFNALIPCEQHERPVGTDSDGWIIVRRYDEDNPNSLRLSSDSWRAGSNTPLDDVKKMNEKLKTHVGIAGLPAVHVNQYSSHVNALEFKDESMGGSVWCDARHLATTRPIELRKAIGLAQSGAVREALALAYESMKHYTGGDRFIFRIVTFTNSVITRPQA